jgi:pimeloyl-ACP methyl ester carboxylesterase
LVDALRVELEQTPVAVTRGDFRACDNFDAMHRIGNLRLPTLVISGSRDRLTPPKYGEFLASEIDGARHVIIPKAGHMMALEYPEVFTDHVVSFMAANIDHPGV